MAGEKEMWLVWPLLRGCTVAGVVPAREECTVAGEEAMWLVRMGKRSCGW